MALPEESGEAWASRGRDAARSSSAARSLILATVATRDGRVSVRTRLGVLDVTAACAEGRHSRDDAAAANKIGRDGTNEGYVTSKKRA